MLLRVQGLHSLQCPAEAVERIRPEVLVTCRRAVELDGVPDPAQELVPAGRRHGSVDPCPGLNPNVVGRGRPCGTPPVGRQPRPKSGYVASRRRLPELVGISAGADVPHPARLKAVPDGVSEGAAEDPSAVLADFLGVGGNPPHRDGPRRIRMVEDGDQPVYSDRLQGARGSRLGYARLHLAVGSIAVLGIQGDGQPERDHESRLVGKHGLDVEWVL